MSVHEPLPLQQHDDETERMRVELALQKRNMRLLRDVALASRGLADPRAVFQVMYEHLRAVLSLDAFFVALCDRPDSQFYHFALFVDEGEYIDLGDERVGGLTGWILDIKQSRLFRDLHRERDDTMPAPEPFGNIGRRSRSWIGVPLMIGRESVGVISVQSYQPNLYTVSDLELVEALADLASVAIENAILYRAQDELSQSLATRVAARSEELAVLTAIASGLSRGQYNTERLTEATERILWMLNLRAGAVWLDDPPAGLRLAAAYAVTQAETSDLSFTQLDDIALEALAENRTIMHPWPEAGSSNEDIGESVFAVPLQAHGRMVGVLIMRGQPGRELAPHELSLLEAASQQMAIGLENARLYRDARYSAAVAERRADNLELVHSISRLISSSLDPQQIVRTTAEQMMQLFGVDHCAVQLYDELAMRGEIVAEYPELGAVGLRSEFLPSDYPVATQDDDQPVLITDINGDPRVRPVREALLRGGVQSTLLIPLMLRNRSIGVIAFNMIHAGREFAEEERDLCRTIAAQVAIALENARLFQVSVTRVEQEMEIARSFQANLFPRSLPHIPNALLAGRCLPALETGGDFYDVLPLGDNRYGLSIGDVSGKSLPAAMIMAVARSIVRSEAIDHAAPEHVVTETNRLVFQDVPTNTFVALCYAVYNAHDHSLVLANAGQITPVLRRRDGVVQWLPTTSHLPLGMVPDLQYASSGLTLQSGDSVLFLTDGLVEAFSPQGEMFGFDRLTDLYSRRGYLPATELVSELLDTVCAWQGNENRSDDMTAIVLQVQ